MALIWCCKTGGDARVEHRSHKGRNNRAENSHVPLRKRERMMQGFRSVGGLQRFTSIFSALRNLFVPRT
uniref:DDE-type integrase/transposase/recombinase n=1 Tax=Rhizobium meliloti TaxID=382 RepID=UPI0035AB72B7